MKEFLVAKHDKNIRSRLQTDANLLGVGVGLKEVRGQPTKDLSLKLYVRNKIPDKDLSKKDNLKGIVGTTLIDVVQLGPLRARGSFKQRVRPGLGGCSGCVVVPNLVYTGTLGLGMRGFGGLADRVFVLSNNHVLANENRAMIGDPVIQPGGLDGGDPANDTIGHLFDFVKLRMGQPGDPNPPINRVDAACAEVNSFGEFTREIFWVGYPKGWRARKSVEQAVAQGQSEVQKTGRTTGYTTGRISDVSFDGWVGYSSGDAYFEDQLLIVPGSFSAPGDSGSCILDMDENVVGLLFAGGTTHTIANYIEDVWQLLAPINFSDGRV